MTLHEIRERYEASPFRPFTLRLSSGREIAVEHPEFMLVPPEGGVVVVWDREKHIHIVDVGHIEEIDNSPVKNVNGRKRRQ